MRRALLLLLLCPILAAIDFSGGGSGGGSVNEFGIPGGAPTANAGPDLSVTGTTATPSNPSCVGSPASTPTWSYLSGTLAGEACNAAGFSPNANTLAVTFTGLAADAGPNPDCQVQLDCTNGFGSSQDTLGLSVAATGSTLTAVIEASRTSCTAPCLVFFDAHHGSTSQVDTWSQVWWVWGFGDPSAGTWSTGLPSLNSRNADFGPIASHVFATPGSYTVTLNGTEPDGDTGADSVLITVADPDVTYAGTLTTCVSTTTDQTGCPAGATQASSLSDLGTALSTYGGTGKRILLHRGQTFSVSAKYTVAGDDMLVGAYGTGAQPIVSKGVFDAAIYFLPDDRQGLTLAEVDYESTAATSNEGLIDCEEGNRHILLYSNTISGFYHGILCFGSGIASGTRRAVPKNMGLVGNTFIRGTGLGYFINCFWEDSAIVGNLLDYTAGHSNDHIRCDGMFNVEVSHNTLQGGDKTGMKVHAARWNTSCTGTGSECPRDASGTTYGPTRYVHIAWNEGDHDLGSSTSFVVYGTQNVSSDERLHLALLEGNWWHGTGGTCPGCVPFQFYADEVVARNNIIDSDLGNDINGGVSFGRRGVELSVNGTADHFGNRAYHNSCRHGAGTQSVNCVRTTGGTAGGGEEAIGNLAVNLGTGSVIAHGGTWVAESSGITSASNIYASATPTAPADYEVTLASVAENAVPAVTSYATRDIDGGARATPAEAGAFERP